MQLPISAVINTHLHPISFQSYRRLLFKFGTKNGHFAFFRPLWRT